MSQSLDVLDRYKSAVDRRLASVPGRFACEEVLKDAMAYALEGGKRLRGSILLSFFEELDGTSQEAGGTLAPAMDFAAALEMIHAYSLVHDDLPCMDDDDSRRGRPSCHKKFGYATALLTGDALLTAAFHVAASCEIPADRVARGIAILSRAAGPSGMVGGQILDLALEGQAAGAGRVREMYALKTAALFEAAATLGAVLAGASKEAEEAAGRWGFLFGFAYQVLDDIDDLEQSAKEDEKDTLPRETSPAAARAEALQALESALSLLEAQFEGRAALAAELTKEYLRKAATA